MDMQAFLPHRAALIGAAVALTAGLTGGVILKTGPQTEPQAETFLIGSSAYAEAEPVAWPRGQVPDYVIGTDFLKASQADPPAVVAAYEVAEYVPASWPDASADAPPAWTEPAPQVPPPPSVETDAPSWPSVQGDILDVRLPEDLPPVPAPAAAAPVTLVAAS